VVPGRNVFSMDYDFLHELGPVGRACFQDGGSKPDVVYGCNCLRRIRGFLVDLKSPSLIKRGSTRKRLER